MTPTRIRNLLLIAVVAIAVGWFAVQAVEFAAGRFFPVPWTAAMAMGLLAVCLFIWTLLARPRLLRRPGHPRMAPVVAARTAALAMAGSRTGAAVFGFYSGVVLGLLPAFDTEAGQQYIYAGVVTAVASLALAVVAYWLETLCRLPGDDGEEGAGGSVPRKARPGQSPSEATRTTS